MDLTEILWWSAGMFLLGILAGAAGMYRVQRKERSRELKKISDTVQRIRTPRFFRLRRDNGFQNPASTAAAAGNFSQSETRCTERTERTSGTDFGNRTSDADTIDKSEKLS